MKQNYNNKTKLRSAWFALVLLMLTALPITAQNKGDRFQVGQLWYEVVDAVVVWCRIKIWSNVLDQTDVVAGLWFDVESRYEATDETEENPKNELWFDVESRYEATLSIASFWRLLLWFDVESRYEATVSYWK